MATKYSISVIVPVFNEIELLETSISQISIFLQSHFADYEILIVESGSTDGSGEACDRLTARFPLITVIHEGKKTGFGSALKIGYAQARKDLIWLIVVDMPFPLETILTALPLFSEYDCVFSYRSKDNRSFLKRFRSYIYNVLAKTILGLRVKHVNSAFRIFRRGVIQALPLESKSWTLDAEVLYEITRRQVPYTEIPVELKERLQGKTTISVSDPVSMLSDLFRIRRIKQR
ncbi:MAG: glycosyltransferase family 2 protein [Chloroflexota bacterium]